MAGVFAALLHAGDDEVGVARPAVSTLLLFAVGDAHDASSAARAATAYAMTTAVAVAVVVVAAMGVPVGSLAATGL